MSRIFDDRLPLSVITRLSPLNPRQDMTSDVSTLAATIRARGLLHPILVHSRGADNPGYAVLAGGRRWRALQSLLEPGEDVDVAVRIFEGSDAEAREAALAEAVTQKPLHPVEEFEAFSDLEKAGLDVATIARDFALTEKRVRQSLALGRLSLRVRDLWRRGEISRDIAESFAAGSIEAQEALLDSDAWQKSSGMTAYAVRRSLLADTLDASDSEEAQFLLSNAAALSLYRDAGGRLDEELFTGAIFRDAALAREAIAAACRIEALRLCEIEGWGGALVYQERFRSSAIEPDYTAKEEKRRATIDVFIPETFSRAKVARVAGDEATAQDLSAQAETAEREREEIEATAILRAVSKKARKDLCVYVDARSDGTFEVLRAVRPAPPAGAMTRRPDDADDDDETEYSGGESDESRAAPKARERKEPVPPPPPPPPGGADAQVVLDAAIGEALSAATARNLNLALAITVAALGCSHGRAGVGLTRDHVRPTAFAPHSEMLARILHERFERALDIIAGEPLNDVTVAFAELVSDAIDFEVATPAGRAALLSLAEPLCDLSAGVRRALDYSALFAASPREEAIAAIRALDGEAAAAEASKLRKPKLIERAALLARDREWLPDAVARLLSAPSKDERSTAEAMVDAIESDEERQAARAPRAEASA